MHLAPFDKRLSPFTDVTFTKQNVRQNVKKKFKIHREKVIKRNLSISLTLLKPGSPRNCFEF